MNRRSSGVLLHVTSLPSRFGIGDLGVGAYKFVDFLAESRQGFWQILPLNPTQGIFGDSPYSSPSAFATNSLMISPDLLVEEGFLKEEDVQVPDNMPAAQVDYDRVRQLKQGMLDKAFERFNSQRKVPDRFKKFCDDNKFWLDDYAMFIVIKENVSEKIWTLWPKEIRLRETKALNQLKKEYAVQLLKVKFIQYMFFTQWIELKDYCDSKGVLIIGDIPIYVGFDSVDVWMNPSMFELDGDMNPAFVAGVPPDYFSTTGQRWGNPVYNWKVIRKAKFKWWLQRIKHNLKLFDMVRIDHFRGLVQFWAVPQEEETAINGEWRDVPTYKLFDAVAKDFPNAPIIAEDLGIITPDVTKAMKHYKFPGMKILVFAFNGDMNTHPYLPHNFKKNCVVYTGTHDNNTAQGWYQEEAQDWEKNNFKEYYKSEICENDLPDSEVHWGLIEIAMESCANLAITPLQDIFGLGADGRMNVPGTGEGNWGWRFNEGDLQSHLAAKMAELVQKTNRLGQEVEDDPDDEDEDLEEENTPENS